MEKKFVAWVLLVVACVCVQARPRPSWMTELPLPGNSTYIYVKEAGQGKTATEALNWAVVHVFENTARRFGRPFNSQDAFSQLQGGVGYEEIAAQYGVPLNLVDRYVSKEKEDVYWVYVLCQVGASTEVPPIWDRGKNIDRNYDWTCLYRSVVPGLGQMSKGYIGEGVVTLSAEVLLVGSAVGCYFLAERQFENIMASISQGDVPSRMAAMRQYETLRNTQSFLWGAAGALYVFNFVRAFTLDPKSTTNLVFAPSLLSTPYTVAPSVGLTWRF